MRDFADAAITDIDVASEVYGVSCEGMEGSGQKTVVPWYDTSANYAGNCATY